MNNFSDINLLESLPPLRILDGAVSDWRYEGLHPAGVINIIELYQSRMLPSSDSNILPFLYISLMDAPGNANKDLNYVKCDRMYRKFGI